MRKRRLKPKKNFWILVLIILIFLFNNYDQSLLTSLNNQSSKKETDDVQEKVENVTNDINPSTTSSNLKISFLDVGQADSILIENNGEYMLIDVGNNEDGKKLVKYFQDLGITKFKYVVGTHPHEDHIGGLDDIINSFDIDTIYLPDADTDTKTFEDVLDALINKNMSYKVPKIDSNFTLGEANFTVLYTGTDISDLNNTSIVLKMDFGNNSFLFMGDATSKVEEIILNKDIDVDVLKVGHHGSRYSSSEQFLDKITTKYAIISCGKNNSYNHPHDETIKKLEERNIKIYRTDEVGTIIMTSDGNNINISSLKTDTNG